MREISDKVGAILMADMAHISGLVATGLAPSPFDHCHVVTTTTHKTLRGPRGALIIAQKNVNGRNLIQEINEAVFPAFQAGPHNHTIGAIATALKEANSEDFKQYQIQVLKNSRALADELMKKGFNIFTNGTDNHIVVVDLRTKNIDGERVEYLLNKLNITINKNTIKGDLSAFRPSGLRLGSPAMTVRGADEKDFRFIANLISEGVDFAIKTNTFKEVSEYNNAINEKVESDLDLQVLKKKVTDFAGSFPFNHLDI
jgi:glycine hydroxymethyltransferase